MTEERDHYAYGQDVATSFDRKWQDSVAERAFQKTVRDAQTLLSFYRERERSEATLPEDSDEATRVNTAYQADRKFIPNAPATYKEYAAQRQAGFESDYVIAYEEAVAEHGDEIPFDFMMEFDPTEIRILGEAAGLPGAGEMADEMVLRLENEAATMAWELQKQQEIDTEVQRQIDMRDKTGLPSWMWISPNVKAAEGLLGMATPEDTRTDKMIQRDVTIAKRMQSDEKFDDEIEKFVQRDLREFLNMIRNSTLPADPSVALEKQRAAGEAPELLEASGGPGTDAGTELESGTFVDTPTRRRWQEYESSLARAGGVDFRQMSDDEMDEWLDTRESLIRQQIRLSPKDHALIIAPGDGVGAWGRGGEVMGEVMDKGAQFGALVARMGPGTQATVPVLTALFGSSEDAANESMRQIELMDGLPRAEILAANFGDQAGELFEELDPETKEEYVQMGMGDLHLARSLYTADLITAISPEDQIKYIENVRNQNETQMQALADQDFTVGADMLHLLGVWGRNVPGRLSTYASLLLTDGDYFDKALTGQWIEFGEQLETQSVMAGHTPSRALGIDGSFAGLMLDIGGGIIFDPTTWIFAPAGAARGGAVSTARGVGAWSKSTVAKQTVRDFMKFGRDPSSGSPAMWNLMNWLDGPARSEMLVEIGWRTKTIPRGAWRETSKKAIVMERNLLDDLMSPEDLAKYTPDELTSMRAEIADRGFDEAIEVSYSRADGTMWVSDGGKRIAATGDIEALPVRIRVTEQVKPGTTVLPNYGDDTVRNMNKVMDDLVPTSGPPPSAAAQAKSLQAAADDVVRSPGKPLQQFENNGNSYTLHSTTVEGTRAPGSAASTGDPSLDALRRASAETADAARDQHNIMWYVTDESGDVVGMYDGFMIVRKPGAKYSRLMDDALDAGERSGEGFLERLVERGASESAAFSERGVSFVKRATQRYLDEALPTGNRVGRSVDDLLEKGESLARPTYPATGSVEDVFVRPNDLLPHRLVHGDISESRIMDIAKGAIARGAVPDSGQYSALALRSGNALRKLLRSNAPGRWLQRNTGAFSSTKWRSLSDLSAVDDLVDDMFRMFGDDTEAMTLHLDKIFEWEAKNHTKNSRYLEEVAKLGPKRSRLIEMEDTLGTPYDEPTSLAAEASAKVKPPKEVIGESVERQELRNAYHALDKELKRDFARIDAETGVLRANDELEKIMKDIWDEFYDTRIATNPVWKGYKMYNDDGSRNWAQISAGPLKEEPGAATQAGREAATAETMQGVGEELGVDAEKLMQQLSHGQNVKLSTVLEASPLEMIIASELGGAAWKAATHNVWVGGLRETAQTLNRLWTIDKVFTLATAATVSFDELLRIFHRFGMRSITRWGRDRAIYTQARIAALAHPTPGVAGQRTFHIGKEYGSEFLKESKQARMQILEDYGTRFKTLERQMFEQHGLGWQDILPGDSGFHEAARAYTGGMVQDTGFRSFLRGREAFREWFLSPDGERLRQGTVMTMKDGKASTLIATADDYFDGWTSLFDRVVLHPARKAGKYDEVRAAWVETAAAVDASGGVAKELPDLAINHMGAVRGVKRNPGGTMDATRLTEGFFDKLFMDPTNYRRGFLADLTRTHEKARLLNLARDQGIQVVSDPELEAILGLQGLAGSQRTGLQGVVHEMAVKAGYMPESMIDNLAEKAVRKEIEHTLYQFDVSSRLGAASRMVAPFGKPWADMAAFWGKNVMRKPVLRGWINEKNALGLRTLNEKGLLSFPVPNKSAALISRMAHTDFEIDKGFFGGDREEGLWGTAVGEPGTGISQSGGIIPGSESTNFSPLFFMPTQGENPFQYMLPGLGVVPVYALDLLMSNLYDPVKEPEEYQTLKDNIGQVVTSANFAGQGGFARLFGGGTTGKAFGITTDLVGMSGHNSYFNITSAMGDITRELNRTREISALMADPAILATLLAADDEAEAMLLLESLVIEADTNASQAHLATTVLRSMAPISSEFSAAIGEIQDVWIEAAAFEEFTPLMPQDFGNMTEEEKRQVANDIRSEYFTLEAWQRDAMIVQQPSLAVNLVGSWEWTFEAKNQALEGTNYSYSTGGTKADLHRHEALVRAGMVRPIQPIERAQRILGVIDAARRSAATAMYTEQVEHNNDLIWEVAASTDEDTQSVLNFVLTTSFAEDYDLRTPEEVWRNWSTIEDDLEYWFAKKVGVEAVEGESGRKEDQTDFDTIKRMMKIAEDMKPWGVSFPGIDELNVSDRFNQLEMFRVTDKTQYLADAVGIHVEAGMTGEDLYYAAQQVYVQQKTPTFAVARPAYNRYVAERGTRTGRDLMHEAAQSDLISEDVRETIQQFLFKDQIMNDRRQADRRNGLSLSDQQRMRDEFLYIMKGSKVTEMDIKDEETDMTPWEMIWEEQYEDTYGPLDWEPPEPISPLKDDGSINDNVLLPSIKIVHDGDTIQIQEYPGSPNLRAVRLLGIRAPELGGKDNEAAIEAEEALKDAIVQGVNNGDRIYLVRDSRFGNTDHYGRMLAWLWIGDTPYYNPDDLRPHQDPSN